MPRKMNRTQFVIVLIEVVGVSLVYSQCIAPPPIFKRPDDCCTYGKLISDPVMDECRLKAGPPKIPPPSGSRQPGELIRGSCKTECAFNQTGLFVNGELNEQQIRTTFVTNSGAAFTSVVNSALEKCLPLARSRAAEFTATVISGANKCNPITGFLFMCVNSNMVANCPTANFQSDDADCVSLQTFFRQCS